MRRLDPASRWTRSRAVLVVAFCGFALLGWQGVTTVGHNGPIDAAEHLRYAEHLASDRSLPSKSQNYEYASPPLYQATAVAAEKLVRELPAEAAELPWNFATRGLWLALVLAGVAAMTASRRRVRIVGVGTLGLAALWGLDDAISLCKSEEWSAGQLITFGCGMGLIGVTGLIAREVWPDRPRYAVAAGGFAAAYPVVYRMSILFHPEIPFAFLAALAILVFLRAAGSGWPARLAWYFGATCAAAAVTRQPAILMIACLAAATTVLAGRDAWRFLGRAAIPLLLIAGPWWVYAAHRWHNPLQSNLELPPARMLDHQPPGFYFSVPLRSLVVHPYRPDSTDALLPKLHADLWSDWYGALHAGWSAPTRLDRVTASSQSILGLFADALTLVGLAALAAPAAIRVLRRRSRDPSDIGLGLLAAVACVAFAGFAYTLVRFPQRDGDPIKTSYLLFTTPCWAIFAVAAWAELRRRSRRLHLVLVGIASLYVVSYAADLGSALSQPAALGNTGKRAPVVDLATSFQQNSPNPGIGGPVDLLAGVVENGGLTASAVRLEVKLPPEMVLLGPPYVNQGSGCSGTRTIRCTLGDVPAGGDAFIRFSVDVTSGAPLIATADASSVQADADSADNTASFTITLGHPS
ncbi:MAG TPA: hypothetical protein VGM80_00065 [Gaiellaceae bacterium]